MSPEDSNIPSLEHSVLVALCSAGLSVANRTAAIGALSKYGWNLPDHRVIYAALCRSGHRPADELRDHLKAEVTRLGFPELEWESYFVTLMIDAAHVQALVRELLNSAPDIRQ